MDEVDVTRNTATESTSKPVIYITGFGPFGPYEKNASEEAVILLSKSDLADVLEVELVTQILDVDYKKTMNIVPESWKKLKPKLVIHVGVAGNAEHLTLEERAFNTGYNCRDVLNACPDGGCCVSGGCKLLYTTLPLPTVAETLNSRPHLRLKATLSQNPGRYLCSYVYYTSLLQDPNKSVFIHVPPVEVSTLHHTTMCLYDAIVLLYRAVTTQDNVPTISATLPNDETKACVDDGVLVANTTLPNDGTKDCIEDGVIIANVPKDGVIIANVPKDGPKSCIENGSVFVGVTNEVASANKRNVDEPHRTSNGNKCNDDDESPCSSSCSNRSNKKIDDTDKDVVSELPGADYGNKLEEATNGNDDINAMETSEKERCGDLNKSDVECSEDADNCCDKTVCVSKLSNLSIG